MTQYVETPLSLEFDKRSHSSNMPQQKEKKYLRVSVVSLTTIKEDKVLIVSVHKPMISLELQNIPKNCIVISQK